MPALLATLARLGALMRKELLAVVKDPANRLLLLAPALLQAMLFGYGATYELTNVPYAVLDQSRGAASTQLLARVDGTGFFKLAATLESPRQIAEVIDTGKAAMVLSIPPDFENLLAAGRQAPLQVILDARNPLTAGSAASDIGAIVADFNDGHAGAGAGVTLVRRAWFNANLQSRWNIMPGLIATLSMVQTLLLAALSVAREREQGTFDQLLVTPLTPMLILIGKALPSMLVGLVQSTIIFMIVRFWFHIPMSGSILLMYLGLLTFTGATVGIGLSISALSLTMQQAMLYTFMVVMPLVLLSGLITPVGNMPRALQIATYVNPLRFGLDIVRRVYLEGAGPADVAPDFIPLLAVAAVTLPLAAWLFRNRLS